MTKILVAEDSKTQALQVKLILEKNGFEVLTADNGVKALEVFDSFAPDIVLTDLDMPEMDGLELVGRIKDLDVGVPVVLMTNRGSEKVAMQALRAGAANYLPKRILQTSLVDILREVEGLARKTQDTRLVFSHQKSAQYEYEMGNKSELIQPLVSHFAVKLESAGFSDIDVMQITMALTESLTNAINHGNLELDSSLRELEDGGVQYHNLAMERRELSPYMHRSASAMVRLTSDEVTFVIEDQGPGFDVSKIPDPTDPENLEKASGRGLMLIFTFMDEVRHNESGNEITMIKKMGEDACFGMDEDED